MSKNGDNEVFGGASHGGFESQGEYSITQEIVINHSFSGDTSFDAKLTVPDSGSTVAFLGLGLLALTAISRRLNRN